MTDLERELSTLAFEEPSARLDDRVHSALWHASPQRRRGTEALSFSFLMTVAAACLVVGSLTGYTVAAWSGDQTGRSAESAAAGPGQDSFGTANSALSNAGSVLLTAHLSDARYEMCQRCHQSVESVQSQMDLLRRVARHNAERWEVDSGEEFLLASHVTDSRFVACRQCHVPDSVVESM